MSTACTVIEPGKGDAYWVVGDHIAFKLSGEQTNGAFAFAETTVAPGGGPPPHVHNREDELFYILDGRFGFILGNHTLSGSTGDAFYLPRGIVHTFKNVGQTPGRLLVGTTPPGFEKFIPEAGCVCTDASSPAPPIDDAAIATLMAACGRYGVEMKFDFKPGTPAPPRPTGREFWVAGCHVQFKLTTADTNGHFSLFEATIPPGNGYPPHSHRERHDVFYVLEGTLEFDLGGQKLTAPPGTFIHVPPGIKFGVANTAATNARLLDGVSPGGFEPFFEEVGVPCTNRNAPPPALAPDMAKLAAAFARYDMSL